MTFFFSVATESMSSLDGEPHHLRQPESVSLIHGHLYLAQNKLCFPLEQELYFHQYHLMNLLSPPGHLSVLYLEGLSTLLYIN